jgi:hypothetical protein
VVNASGTYNNSGSNHDEARFCCRYSCGYNSYCCHAAKNITRLTAAKNGRNPVLRNREAPGDGRRLVSDTTVVIITQPPAVQATNAT